MSKKKPPQAEPKKLGRPLKEIDWEQVKKACQLQHTEAEVAFLLGCNVDTLGAACKREHGKTFSEYYKENCVGTPIVSLRRLAWSMALEQKNEAMIRMLWKEYISAKSDNPEINITHLTIAVDDLKRAVSTDNFIEIPVGGVLDETK